MRSHPSALRSSVAPPTDRDRNVVLFRRDIRWLSCVRVDYPNIAPSPIGSFPVTTCAGAARFPAPGDMFRSPRSVGHGGCQAVESSDVCDGARRLRLYRWPSRLEIWQGFPVTPRLTLAQRQVGFADPRTMRFERRGFRSPPGTGAEPVPHVHQRARRRRIAPRAGCSRVPHPTRQRCRFVAEHALRRA